MSGVNKVILVGRLGKDPELKTFDSGTKSVALSLATSESWRDKTSGQKKEVTEWHNVIAWRELAEIVSKYCKKGDLIYVEGKLTTRSWEKDGERRYTTEVVASNITMMGAGAGNRTEQAQPQTAQKQSAPAADQYNRPTPGQATRFTDDLPF